MSNVRITIQPTVLEWALKRTGMDADELERTFPRVSEWSEGISKPTLRQAQKLAKRARIPFGRLLLNEPSGEGADVADFRTVKNVFVDEVSPDLQEVISSSQNRLAWYSDYAHEVGIEKPELYGSVSEGQEAASAANLTRLKLGLDAECPIPGSDKMLKLVALMEEYGVLVARNSIVESSTHRPLSVDEFRGFTLAEKGFCLVFINARDSKTAQLFSLAHELGHVVLGKPGISDHSEKLSVERWCNRFASEFLAPPSTVIQAFDENEEIFCSLDRLSQKFGISREAMLWRLVQLGLISRPVADETVSVLRNAPQPIEKNSGGGAPPRDVLVRARVGRRFFDTVAHAAENGQIPQITAARYLGASSYESFSKLMESYQRSQQRAV